jgi:predicted transcriptional regulator
MAIKRKPKKPKSDPVAIELGAIKRLLVLQLITSGVQTTKIASALGVNQSSISRLVPARKVKRPSGR